MSNLYLHVGKKIRMYRKARNLTQEELGEYLQIDQSYLGRIERGEVNITLETLYKISDALRVHPARLLEDEKNSRNGQIRSEIFDNIESLLIPLTNEELQSVQRLLKEAMFLRRATQKRT